MTDDHVVVGGSINAEPSAMAKVHALHPGITWAGPQTFERAVAYVRGVEMAAIAPDAGSPFTDEDRAVLMERPKSDRPRR